MIRCTGPCGRELHEREFYAGRRCCKVCHNGKRSEYANGSTPGKVKAPPPSVLEQLEALSVPAEPTAAERAAAKELERATKEVERLKREADERARRRASDFHPLTIDDLANEYDVGVGNQPGQGAVSAQASKEKRQEYNEQMGILTEHLLDAADRSARSGGATNILDSMTAEDGVFIGSLGEQERRFGNRRVARAAAIWLAAEALQVRMIKQLAATHFADKIVPVGYALKPKPNKPAKRSVVLVLSDLHLGSDMMTLDEPVPFGRVEEARRLEHVLRETVDYKIQYRSSTKLVLLIIGDLIEGQLLHQIGAGAPLVEQKIITWHLLSRFIAECSVAYPEVEIHWQGGNHGRDKVRHPGRATFRKYDSHEHEIGVALKAMCSGLKNVTWSIPYKAVSSVDLHGQWLCATHGDTEIRIGHPDAAAAKNQREFDRVNSSRLFGHEYAALVVGHYHTPRLHPGQPTIVYNGMLVPPNGYARAAGYINEPCGMWIWEAVEGFAVGDARYLRVGVRQDHDESLGKILTPCNLSNYLDVT